MHRIVHLDFKGAPVKVQYLDQVLESIKQWGATGVLLEWEDTFPYSGELSIIGSMENSSGDNMYSMDEVQQILQSIKNKGLEPIQLVQTIGHMEFVLKHPPFRELREEPRSPAVLCPTKPKSQQLVRAIVQNTLEAQPDAKYFHIGADEVWHTAVCEDCQRKASISEYKATSLFLDHIRDLLLFIKTQRPKMNILMWDDMLRSISFEALEKSNIAKLVEPVVWNYNVAEHFFVGGELWRTYRLFPKVWAASAFKGANGSSQILSPVSRYMSNQQAWIREVQGNSDRVNFTGVILTGWSRFDHYATLCELLPVSLPALYSCLSIWIHPNDSISSLTHEVLPEASWAGVAAARGVHSLVALRDRAHHLLHGDAVSTWLNPWQVERGYTCPVQIDGIAATANELLQNLQCLEREMTVQLSQVTGPRSTAEWVGSHVSPLVSRITALHRLAIQLVQTIGHMEFVLKHPPFRELREEPRSPAVLCPTKPKSQQLVRAIVQNTLEAQPDAKYFHIGADEVWHTAVCEDCQRKASISEYKATSLFLDHIRDLLLFIKTQRPKMNILMWDDMLRSISFEALEKSNIAKLVEPVVWNYNVAEHFFVGGELWRTYRLFPKVWAASAFKGANGSSQILSPVSRYMSNQQAWIREVQGNSDRVNFTGVILTGWSRFDHYATLCELLPVSLPALYSCLSIWIHPNDSISSLTHEVLPEASWAGVAAARGVHSLVALRDRAHHLLHGDAVSTWLNPWQVERGYTCPVQIDGIAATANELLQNLQCLEREMTVQLSQVTGPRSTAEWVGSHVSPLVSRITALHRLAVRTAAAEPSIRPVF